MTVPKVFKGALVGAALTLPITHNDEEHTHEEHPTSPLPTMTRAIADVTSGSMTVSSIRFGDWIK